MKLIPQLDITANKFVELLRQRWTQLAFLFNGNISFGDGTNSDNISGVWVTVNSVIGNFTVNHNLGRIPAGYIIASQTAFEVTKFVSSTTTQITLAGQNGGSALTLFIF